jgi:hypothetical protein
MILLKSPHAHYGSAVRNAPDTRRHNSNTTKGMRTALATFGLFSAMEGKLAASKAPPGALMLARTCRTRSTRRQTGGAGWMDVSMNT